MAMFEEPQEIYDTLGVFLRQIVEDPVLGPKFSGADTSFHITYTDPACELAVDCTTSPATVSWEPGQSGEIRLTMSADDGHLFWLGKLNMTIALAKKKVSVRGPMSKMMRLLPAMRPAFPMYREFLNANGHADKVVD